MKIETITTYALDTTQLRDTHLLNPWEPLIPQYLLTILINNNLNFLHEAN